MGEKWLHPAESMRQAGAIDVAAVAEVVRSLVGDDDRVSRLLALP